MTTTIKLLAVFCLSVSLSGNLQAQTARLVHYQGSIMNPEGEPFSGVCNLEFKIYKGARDAAPVWSELHKDVEVREGNYEVLLGSRTPLRLSYYEYFLEIAPSVAAEQQPRRMIVGSGYNYRLSFLFAAYTIVWLAIFLYVLSVARRQKKIATELETMLKETAESAA